MIKRLDSRPIPNNKEEIRAFLVIRNEALRLPSTLRHIALWVCIAFSLWTTNRPMGLSIIFWRNRMFMCSRRPNGTHSGVVWTNALLDNFGAGHWTLTIDADEQLIYPQYEQIPLPVFATI